MNNVIEDKVEKLYFKIGNISKMINEPTSTIRFWEDEFRFYIRKVNKNSKGLKIFNRKQALKFNVIKALIVECGLTIKGAGNAIKEGWAGEVINTIRNWRKGIKDENI